MQDEEKIKMTRTLIVATIGPTSKKKEIISRMVKNGMDIARINTKWASKAECENYIKILREFKIKILIDINSVDKLRWVKKLDFDYLALSYAESAVVIKKIKKELGKKVISKIETKKGISNINEIIKSSDGIMVARGDLGKNLPYVKLPIYQKMIIRKCNLNKKFVITATEMLLSMVNDKKPKRSEITDVSNAIIDGTNAVMLSEESAIGKHPALVIKVMNNIIKETEKNLYILNGERFKVRRK